MASQAPESAPVTNLFEAGQRRLGGWLFAVRHAYDDELDQQRASALSIMSLLFAFLGLGGVAVLAIFAPGFMPVGLSVLNVGLGGVYLLAFALVQTGRLRQASVAFIVMTLLVPAVQSIPFDFIRPEIAAVGYCISILSAAFLLGAAWAAAGFAVSGGLLAASLLIWQAGDAPGSAAQGARLVDVAQIVFLIGVLALFAWLLNSSLFNWAIRARRRAQLLEVGAVVTEAASAAASRQDLLNTVVNRIREAYGFYHAQVFLLDSDRRMARLEASTGRAGEVLLLRGHALPVGSQSVIGECTATGQPVVVNDVRTSRVHRPNELLPNTAAELALPLILGGRVIGALDVQSTTANAFSPDDVRSLQMMAGQLSTAIDKARLLDELQMRAAENERLLTEAQRALEQIEDLNRRLTREGWSDYLRVRRGTVGYSMLGGRISPAEDWSAPMRQAYQGESSVIIRHDQEARAHIAAVPLRVRGEVIGVLEFERGGDRPWGERELDLAEALVERLGLAIENARLYEQATSAAQREQVVNRIAQEVQEAQSIDQVLQAALADIGEVLGASRGIVQISPKAGGVPGEDNRA
jgi:GAF domain-containing protein